MIRLPRLPRSPRFAGKPFMHSFVEKSSVQHGVDISPGGCKAAGLLIRLAIRLFDAMDLLNEVVFCDTHERVLLIGFC